MQRITLEDPKDFIDYREGSGGTVEIFDIVINTERGVGKGRKLVEILKSRVKSHLIFAITRETNEIAKEFYVGIGFRLIARLPLFYPPDEDKQPNAHALMYGLDLPKSA